MCKKCSVVYCDVVTDFSLEPSATLSDYVMVAILELLKKEISEHGRHLAQYFHLFLMYANIGVPEVCNKWSHHTPLTKLIFFPIFGEVVQ